MPPEQQSPRQQTSDNQIGSAFADGSPVYGKFTTIAGICKPRPDLVPAGPAIRVTVADRESGQRESLSVPWAMLKPTSLLLASLFCATGLHAQTEPQKKKPAARLFHASTAGS